MHCTTDVTITEHTTSHDQFGSDLQYRHLQNEETHTFVNAAREFSTLIEVGNRTLKVISVDYIAIAEGDKVRAICEFTRNGPLLVRDWHNQTRNIRFRNLPSPLDGASAEITWAIGFIAVTGLCLYAVYRHGMDNLIFGATGAIIIAAVVAINACRTARLLARMHVELNRLI